MARPNPTACEPESPPLDRFEDLALDVPTEEAPGADQVDAAALSVAVDEGYDPPEPDWEDWKDTYADAVGVSRWREL